LFFGNTLPQSTVVARWEDNMDNTTLIIIIIVVLLIGGGWYGRGRWY
jgi:Na+-transporting methylmalonyl-CoA/oxaloacetate decarboxylase beta subunit